MSLANVESLPSLQALQRVASSVATAEGTTGSSCPFALSDTISISQEAIERNVSQTRDDRGLPQVSDIYGPQGRYHDQHQPLGRGQDVKAFINPLDPASVTNLQQATGGGTSSVASSASTNAAGGAINDGFATRITDHVVATYQHHAAFSSAPSQTSTNGQVNWVG